MAKIDFKTDVDSLAQNLLQSIFKGTRKGGTATIWFPIIDEVLEN